MPSLAACFTAAKTPLVLQERPLPVPGPGEALVALEACGLGFGDWNTAMLDALPRLPLVPGQEGAGVVQAVGEGVTLSVGDRVAVTPLAFACGACGPCERGLERACGQLRLTGLHVDGCLATHGVFLASRLVALPAGLASEQAAVLAGSGWTALGALRAAGVGAGVSLGVWGCGGVGHLAVQLGKVLGAREVKVVDPDPSRRALAASLGAEAFEALPPLSVDVAVLCTPSSQAAVQAVKAVRPAGAVALAALTPAGRLDLPLAEVVAKGLRLQGSFLGSRADLQELLELAHTGRVFSTVETFPLEASPDLLWRLRDGGFTGRLVVQMPR
ncbi:MAG: zinc-binding dehydrogenase [Myxococcaceae bacterium]|nr:zinc-binding dehydrogenase [Myxococcaceae bacterium]